MIRTKLFVTMSILALCMAADVASAQGPGMGGPKMDPARQKIHQEMMKQRAADDAKLEELVATMNAARGDAKVDAIAAVVNELVSQHRSMRAHRAQMRAMHGRKGMGKGMGQDDAPGGDDGSDDDRDEDDDDE